MFGSVKRQRERLEKEGRRAPAVVVRAEPTTETLGYPGGFTTDRKWKLTVKVQPPGEPEFEADVKDYFPSGSPPNEGSTMEVFFDSSDHTKVCVEIASVVSAAAPPAPADASASLAETAAEMKTWNLNNVPSLRKQLKMGKQLRALQLAQARGGGMGTLFTTGRTIDLRGQGGPETGQPIGSVGDLGGGSGPADTVDQLSKLADLKDRGMLTEDQFEAAKKQLLGE